MSVQQLVSPHFVDSVRTILRSYGLPPGRLVLELTESQLVGGAGPALQTLQRLQAAGVRLAIDDFGTGYSSLSYLRHMPVQLVKMDRTLLDDIGVDPRATALARSVVSMARDLGLLVVAEGMEDMASVRLLRDLGAYAGQGFALSPALPADQMAAVLAGPPLDLGTGEDDVLVLPEALEAPETVRLRRIREQPSGELPAAPIPPLPPASGTAIGYLVDAQADLALSADQLEKLHKIDDRLAAQNGPLDTQLRDIEKPRPAEELTPRSIPEDFRRPVHRCFRFQA
jgi:hypothetical protein